MFISTHARYLENDDIIQNTPDSGIVIEESSNKALETLVDTVNEQKHVMPNTSVPRHSGRISRPPDRYYRESFQTSL